MPSPEASAADIDYNAVDQYWDNIQPSVLGPYMMDGFGFPPGAGHFRFRSEIKIVNRLIEGANHDGTVLDLGCGVGFWAEQFSKRFRSVIAVEGSTSFVGDLKRRCARLPNIEIVHGDVKSFESSAQCEIVFLGGLLMYLNEPDAIALLRNLVPHLTKNGVILCRESTVRRGSQSSQGEYQAVYRSVAMYERIFKECGLEITHKEINTPYVLMQMGCEWIKRWKRLIPAKLRALPIVGRFAYWFLRSGNPWITRVPEKLGYDYPKLTNHFFLLQPDTAQKETDIEADS